MKRKGIAVRLLVALAAVALVIDRPQSIRAQGGNVAGQEHGIEIDGSTTVGPLAMAFAEYYMALNPNVKITVTESGSGNGATSLVTGKCDIANMSRFMKDKEFASAVANGVTPVAHVVALDGIAVIVHPSNPVRGLTLEQVRKIYKGEIANWKDVGGPDKEIVKISRDTNSGTFDTFRGMVMNDEAETSGTERVNSNGHMRSRVQSTPTAIGYVGLGFVDKTVKALDIENVEASDETVLSGQYPIARPLFMFTNGYPKLGSPVQKFVTLHLSRKGQEIVKSIGFVPLTRY